MTWTPGADTTDVMRADDLANALSPQGFEPFVLNVTNGESYRITHPEQILVGRSTATIGTKRLNGARRYERVMICALIHVVSLIPIEETEVK